MEKNRTNDMTTGNPIKLIIMFMIPMFLGNIFQQFYNIVDSIVAGQFIGVDALAAIGSTGSLMFFVTGWLNGLSSGFGIIVAQMFGAKKYDDMRHFVAMSIYLMFGFAAAMTVGFLVFNVPILKLMNSPADLMGDVAGYMGIIYAGLLVTAAYNTLAAFLRALGDSKSPLYFLIISAGINVILDVVLIRFVGMGVEGCAYATVIAQGVSAVCCLVYIKKKYPILHLEKKNFELRKGSMSKLLILGIPMGLQFSITAIGTIIVQSAVNVYGATHMAGFSAAGKIQNVIGMVAVSMGATIATYVGQNPWSRPYGPRKTGCEIFLHHASCLERDPDDSCVFRRKIFHLPVYQSVRDRGDPGVCDLFPHGILGVSIPGHDLRIPKCPAGNGIRTCSDARRCF